MNINQSADRNAEAKSKTTKTWGVDEDTLKKNMRILNACFGTGTCFRAEVYPSKGRKYLQYYFKAYKLGHKGLPQRAFVFLKASFETLFPGFTIYYSPKIVDGWSSYSKFKVAANKRERDPNKDDLVVALKCGFGEDLTQIEILKKKDVVTDDSDDLSEYW